MSSFPRGLVWLASYPKSGNTWMRVLLANLMAGGAAPADINRLSEEDTLIGRWRFGDDLLVDADLLNGDELASARGRQADYVADAVRHPFFCKTHDRFDPVVLGRRARRALYLVRDPRDVAISLSHHVSMTLDQAIAQMCHAGTRSNGAAQIEYAIGDWAGHVASWTGQDCIPTLTIRYEDLHRDTAATLRAVIAFLGGTVVDDALERAVAFSELKALQRQEATKGFSERRPGQARFFRSGRVGEWREVMTEDQIQALEAHFLPVMQQWGYIAAHDIDAGA